LKQKEAGLKRKLCCITLDEPTVTAIGKEPVRSRGQNEILGWVTSGGYGYTVGKSIAYAYLPAERAKIGAALDIEILGERIPAKIEREPLWDPKGERIKV
jgi:4-methylaminobutanoate oxidase (formaldehyde-forming)